MMFGLWVIQRNHIWQQQGVKTTFISIKIGLQGQSEIVAIIWALRHSKLKHSRLFEKIQTELSLHFFLQDFQDLISFPFPQV